MRSLRSWSILAFVLLASCTFHTTATRWHGRVGPDGQPVFVTMTTCVGFHLFALIPIIGDTRLDATIDQATAELERLENNYLRVVETDSDNYWYALPPFTWILSPVISAVSIEYRPSAKTLEEARREEQRFVPYRDEHIGDDKVPPPR